jgi:acyl carrier protein
MTLRSQIVDLMTEIAGSNDLTLVSPLLDDTVLLESGLDSLGFAVLVARLEELLGFDPFAQSEIPSYPRTLSDFVSMYDQYKHTK